jgi:tellurite resistance protein TerB
MFKGLLQRAGETAEQARAKMVAEVSKFKNKDFMEAIVDSCAIIAAADGSIDAVEKQKMAGFLQVSEELKHFDMSAVIERFNKTAGNFEFDADIGKAEALKAIGRLKGKDEQARMIVRVACAIGSSDGDFDEKEQSVAAEIARELGLNPADFGLPG